MNPSELTRSRLAVMIVFALTCFGLLLFLWVSFGGSTPLKAKGYRADVLFPEATQLAEQADVRVSGVPIGKVVDQQRDGDRTRATLQIDPRYAPLRADARAVPTAEEIVVNPSATIRWRRSARIRRTRPGPWCTRAE